MARPKEDQIVAAISSVLPTSRIRELARDLGVVVRRRKVDVVCLVQAIVLGFRIDRIRSMSGLRRAYQLMTGQTLARSSFHGRFTAPLVELMRRLTVDALEATAAECNKLRDAFKPFAEVLAIDSSLVRLHAGLKKQYPSVWTNHMEASAKLTIVANVVGRGPKTLAINPGSRSDVHLLRPGKWLRGRLLIFDLGFYQARLFKSIDDHGGYFLSRLRKQGNPTVTKSYRHGQKSLEGKKLNEHQDTVDQDIIDIEGEVTYRLNRNKVTHHTARFRIIAVYNHNLGCWHRYITNAPPQLLPAENVTALFAARWEIELLFRELKTVYRLTDIPSGNLFATQALLYAAVLTLLTSRKLLQLVRKRTALPLHRFPIDRWARLFSSICCELLSLMAVRRFDVQRSYQLLKFLCREAPDPNRSRLLLAERAQNGTMAFA